MTDQPNWKDRVRQLAIDKRKRWNETTRRICGGHITKSKYKGGFVHIHGKGQFGPEGVIGSKK